MTDYERLLATIARTTADLIGDGCIVTLIGPGDALSTAACAHRDGELEKDYLAYVAGTNVTKASVAVSAEVIRTGRAALVPEIDPKTVVARTDDALKPIVERLDVHSYCVVPIRARTTIIGVLSLVRTGPGRSYTSLDQDLLQDLAERAGLAIDNARLYDELERRVRERTAELEAANKELESFSYSIAHDLRAPLRSIDGFSLAVLEECGDQLSPSGAAYLARVRAGAQRMGQLIDDLLGFSRVTRQEVRREEVDVTDLARNVVIKTANAHPGRTVGVTVATGLRASADPRLLEIVLTNLLDNAWKFTRKRDDPRIEVGTVARATPTVFFVRDNGAGFDAAYAKKLFGVFQRLHAVSEFEGTGIGLATVHRIVARHGGRVWAEATVGDGATFFFTLEPPG